MFKSIDQLTDDLAQKIQDTISRFRRTDMPSLSEADDLEVVSGALDILLDGAKMREAELGKETNKHVL